MAFEDFFAVLPESIRRCVNDNLIIAGLECDGFAGGMRGCANKTVHMWLCNSLYRDRDADFPCQDGFVIRARDHAAVVVDESYGCRAQSARAIERKGNILLLMLAKWWLYS